MQAVRPGRPEAAAAIWSPGGPAGLAPSGHAAANARQRGVVRGAIGLAIGIALFFFWSRTMGGIACVFSAITLGTALASPLGAYAKVEALLAASAKAVGTVVTWVVMALAYYLVFAPFGWLTRHGKTDPMHRAFDRSAATYWTPRDTVKRAYDRQF